MMYFEIGDHAALQAALDTMCTRLSKENIPEGVVFDSKLVVNELVINVLRHGGGRAFFRAERKGDELLFCVRGENSFCPPRVSRCSSVSDECGRGLFLVDAVCFRREYSEQDGITVYLKCYETPPLI